MNNQNSICLHFQQWNSVIETKLASPFFFAKIGHMYNHNQSLKFQPRLPPPPPTHTHTHTLRIWRSSENVFSFPNFRPTPSSYASRHTLDLQSPWHQWLTFNWREKIHNFNFIVENKIYQSLFPFLFFFVSFHTSSSQLVFLMILRGNYLVDVNKGNCTTVAYFPKT